MSIKLSLRENGIKPCALLYQIVHNDISHHARFGILASIDGDVLMVGADHLKSRGRWSCTWVQEARFSPNGIGCDVARSNNCELYLRDVGAPVSVEGNNVVAAVTTWTDETEFVEGAVLVY